MRGAAIAVVGLTLVAGACSHPQRPQADLMDRSRDIFLVLRYDTNGDHVVTREEMEAGLKADYAAADTNHDGKLEPDEVRAENQRRWAQEGPQSSPLMDWNQDGNVDITEYANTVHALFTAVDRDKDDKLTVAELQGPRITAPNSAERPPLNPNQDSQPDTSHIPQGPSGSYPGQGGVGYPGQ